MSSISLTASMRSNLSSLRSIGVQMDKTQERLSSGLKVNSAIDNASSYYQSRALTNRAADLNSLLDAMGQGIQTIQAATQGIEAGITYLEQAAAVVSSIMEKLPTEVIKITADMKASEIQTLIKDNVEINLSEDITIDEGLIITAKNVKINGNGYKLNFSSDSKYETAIYVNGGSVDINNLGINANGNSVSGIRVANGGELTIDNTYGINVSGVGSQRLINGSAEIFDGAGNTYSILQDADAKGGAIAAKIVNQFYMIDEKDGNFGAGKWYLPSIGEVMHIFGLNEETGDVDKNLGMNLIGKAIKTVTGTGLNGYYTWSSTERGDGKVWGFNLHPFGGSCMEFGKAGGYHVYAFTQIEDVYNPVKDTSLEPPKIGDIIYADKSYSSADSYDGNKVAVGVVTDISEDSRDVTIMSLGKLAVSSDGSFDVEHPFVDDASDVVNIKYASDTVNVEANTDFSSSMIADALQSRGVINIKNKIADNPKGNIITSKQFIDILHEYDALLKDSSYQGINLLKGGKLEVTFNEMRTNKFAITGKDISAENLGVSTNEEWVCQNDAVQALKEIALAINSIRSFNSELGNSYSIIQTRENFTDGMIDILETGLDMLVLADMNEESAEYLMLQTRQQLAVNSLSLAAQSAQSVLSLF